MTMGKEAPEEKKTIRNHEDCQHGGMYMSDLYVEHRRVYNRDNPSGEYDIEFVDVEVWECPGCGQVDYIDRE